MPKVQKSVSFSGHQISARPAAMNSNEQEPLSPCLVTLSALHLDGWISALDKTAGTEITLPDSGSEESTTFKVILQDSTSHSFVLESFYYRHIARRFIDNAHYVWTALADHGISEVVFTTTLGKMHDQDLWHDRTAPKFKVKGVSKIPIYHQGYVLTPTCFIVDHLFKQRQYESQFVAVLGRDFHQDFFIRAQWSESGYSLEMPQLPDPMDDLIIYTDGCCLSNGQTQDKPARAGYGIYFPQISENWNISSPLSTTEKHTSQRAELTAVIRALELVRARKVPCKKISIFSDSMYAVQGLNEWIPKWRVNGYRNAQKKAVANADLFKKLDNEAVRSAESGILVQLSHVPREENRIADGLAKAGAQGPLGGPGFEMALVSPDKVPGIIGRPLFEKAKPLVQWTPDGFYWAKSVDLRDQNGNITI